MVLAARFGPGPGPRCLEGANQHTSKGWVAGNSTGKQLIYGVLGHVLQILLLPNPLIHGLNATCFNSPMLLAEGEEQKQKHLFVGSD